MGHYAGEMDPNLMKGRSVPESLEPFSSQAGHIISKRGEDKTYRSLEEQLDENPAFHRGIRALQAKIDPFAPVVFAEECGNGKIRYEFENIPTEQARLILTKVLPDVLQLFLEKNRDYGDDSEGRLGPKAQFIDIYRKMKKLKRSLWEGQELRGEQPPEIMQDMIAHLLIALLDIRGRDV